MIMDGPNTKFVENGDLNLILNSGGWRNYIVEYQRRGKVTEIQKHPDWLKLRTRVPVARLVVGGMFRKEPDINMIGMEKKSVERHR
jgi:hypothetical protein